MTGGLPGWWVGVDDGRRYAPTVSPSEWNSVLRKTGFSGVDTITPDRDGLAMPFSILAAQAVDERVSFLRKPLASSSQSASIEELVILGNNSLETSRIAEDVADLVGKYCGKVTILDSLPTDDAYIPPMSTFLNLTDLEEPLFKNMTTEKMDGLKRLFELSRNVLWITKGCLADEPYHMSSVGFGRGVSHEMPYMRLQFLDVENLEDSVSRVIAETLLRLHVTEEWEREEDLHAKLLWSTEPELVIQKDQLMVPRVLANGDQNARLNAWRRPVSKNVPSQTSVVGIALANEMFVLREELLQLPSGDGHKLVNVSHSILSAVKVGPESFLFVNIGTTEHTGETVVSLSEENSSIVYSRVDCVPVEAVSADQAHILLSTIAANLLARSLIDGLPANSILLVHEPEECFASALSHQATAKDIHVTFSTTATESKHPAWITLHPLATERVIKKKLQKGFTHFLNLAVRGNAKDVGSCISTSLPPASRQIYASHLFRDQSAFRAIHKNALSKVLTDAVSHAITHMSQKAPNPIPLGHLTNTAVSKDPITTIDWTADDVVSVQIQPSNADSLFSRDRTYLLVGLTGQIGQSLCEWMARNGAGYICLTSRNPAVDEKWLESFEDTGTIIKVFAMYVNLYRHEK